LRKRYAAIYTLRCVASSIDGDDDAVVLLKPFMPLVRATIRDQQSLRLRSEALYLFTVMLVIHPLLMPDDEFNELSLLLHSLNQCMKDHIDWLERKGASVFYIGGNDQWRTQYGLAIHILIRTAYENATVVIIKLLCLYFVIISFF